MVQSHCHFLTLRQREKKSDIRFYKMDFRTETIFFSLSNVCMCTMGAEKLSFTVYCSMTFDFMYLPLKAKNEGGFKKKKKN